MRTTVTFDDDVAAAISQLRRERHIGVSAVVNELVRRGLARGRSSSPFVQRTSSGHARLDITDVAEVLDVLDGSTAP
ncbi:MAG: CopG family transcriptional regulator [Pseudonocardiaceae bacterium]